MTRLPVSDTATITMSIHDYRRIETEFTSMRDQLVKVETELSRCSPIADPNDPAQDANTLVDAALPIVQFAVANLNPESYSGWPLDSLKTLANGVVRRDPNNSETHRLATAFRQFIQEAEEFEQIRVRRREAARQILDGKATTTFQLPVEESDSNVTAPLKELDGSD